MKNEHRAMTECAAEAARIARGVIPGQLAGPTPCGEWDVRALVNHWVLYTSYGLEHRALRKPLPDELAARDFTADAGWAEQYAAQLDRAVAAWADPAVWEGEFDLGGTALGAAHIASMVVKEMVVHGWDVARATGQEVRISEESAAFVLKVVEDNAELYRQYQGFANPVGVPPTATIFERALAASGRDPHWTA
ncbi:TIGR03086 family metal-binding protein [Streptomyces violascens]|uniref:TIGR03086 family protein n=1 Tax=Streptomyces violascens TaxID=67381 RepID=A0ABQ3QYG2_9ACTN|nr:TIGR03086 family metal-binding protein [Streptomyces violascens]GHI42229.1 TIGR03086 family protein [Streptomyces violascens]